MIETNMFTGHLYTTLRVLASKERDLQTCFGVSKEKAVGIGNIFLLEYEI